MSFRRALYSVFLYLILPIVILRLFWRSRSNPAYRKRISERLGFVTNQSELPVIWLHAVSVGESIAAKPLIELLLEKYPTHRLLVTTTTPTGSDRVISMFGSRVSHVYFPYDLPDAVARFVRTMKPDLLIVMETEIWPNLYAKCHQRSIPIIIANARLSDRSTQSYSKIRGLVEETLLRVHTIAVRAEADAQRFKALGAKPEQIEVVGNIKFDVQLNQQQIKAGKERQQHWGANRPVWVAASTHKGEDEIILRIHQSLLKDLPELLLIIVPRHPERFDDVDQLCMSIFDNKNSYMRHSLKKSYDGNNVSLILGDSMGELQSWYATADVVFIGGSLVNTGGHNPLEATALNVPVVSGKYMFNFDDISHHLANEGLMTVCNTESELTEEVRKWLDGSLSNQQKAEFVQKSEQFMQQHRGVTARLDQLISTAIDMK
ncbi:lipid IV(A) 3-deoxy-D-manno-octulosonic acid transferase [Cocleimonas sp. KMM 6892]|uniref:lipid IV(A) 3-deoxy-D-manno-octulosonic acid transferase n=1 Tax=unclassified Cocleimonas TaxID=2639732 RepID=UPI002DB8454A|nr:MULTISPECIES: lipid IV(A) 3-deoxy-D-manno-octulosonic acid transferase [unclassified Cocleimonas]MEB8432903.1 lipid IV(A) 3-deoxy-D-manno-octulosonic acid transferase [Cocleimonas sp. KMM 6892]MEC4716116.1 lipid IV(A) 3-deoxy-D-manno-octulosonic acid transferase [Cocleimonas sp. KMM 6895]MEC4745577.1 lipid IV(A) 3-deoxy-D-manno-octulosonic acid transferase [Cocleimonas sp. KMM 6896]